MVRLPRCLRNPVLQNDIPPLTGIAGFSRSVTRFRSCDVAAFSQHLIAQSHSLIGVSLLPDCIVEVDGCRDSELFIAQLSPAVPDETEPGILTPGKHPVVAHSRAYCREKLGQSSSADFNVAAHLPTKYVFPNRPEDLEVLRTAARLHLQDATAHYLLGTLFFSRSLTREALSRWEQARMLNPQIPVLHASLGRALLHEVDDPERVLSVFQESLRADHANIELYTGMDNRSAETNELWKWDVAEIFIGADFTDIRRYKEFEISPQGEWVDLEIDLSKPHHKDGWKWNSGFQVSGRIDDAAHVWFGEMKIPYSAIDNRQAAPGNMLRINLFRIQGSASARHEIAWHSPMSDSFHVPERFGLLRLVKKQRRG
jgi:hypothetical protein